MGRKKLLAIVALLSALLIFPLALGANLINVAGLPFLGPVTSSSPTVFVDPMNILNESLQSGSNFTVHVKVSDVADLFTWQINMTWNSSILGVSRIIPGEFLARSENDTSSEALGGVVINSTDNGQGFSLFAESILANVSGITEPGNGTLVSIEFLVLDYGWSNLTISVSGDFPATLLDSEGSSIAFTAGLPWSYCGYFRNKITGDADGDGDVDRYDFLDFGLAYGSTPTSPNWNAECDFDRTGKVDRYDFLDFGLNYGRKMT
jgi:hypothetical protein